MKALVPGAKLMVVVAPKRASMESAHHFPASS